MTSSLSVVPSAHTMSALAWAKTPPGASQPGTTHTCWIHAVRSRKVPSASSHSFLASKLIREIARFGGDVSEMVPPSVQKRLGEKYAP